MEKNLFLLKRELETRLKDAEQDWRWEDDAEKSAKKNETLSKVRDLWTAGVDALATRAVEEAEELFAKAEAGLGEWANTVERWDEEELRQVEYARKCAKYGVEELKRMEEEERKREKEEQARRALKREQELEVKRKREQEEKTRRAKKRKIMYGILFGVLAIFAVFVWIGHMEDKRTQEIIAKAKAEVASMQAGRETGETKTMQKVAGLLKKRAAMERAWEEKKDAGPGKRERVQEWIEQWMLPCLWWVGATILFYVGLRIFLGVRWEAWILWSLVWALAAAMVYWGVDACLRYYDRNERKISEKREISNLEGQMEELDRQIVTFWSTMPENRQ